MNVHSASAMADNNVTRCPANLLLATFIFLNILVHLLLLMTYLKKNVFFFQTCSSRLVDLFVYIIYLLFGVNLCCKARMSDIFPTSQHLIVFYSYGLWVLLA